MFTIHLPYGFSSIKLMALTAKGPEFGIPGYEVNLLYLVGLLTLVMGGAGPLSIDGVFFSPSSPRRPGPDAAAV